LKTKIPSKRLVDFIFVFEACNDAPQNVVSHQREAQSLERILLENLSKSRVITVSSLMQMTGKKDTL